MNFETGDYDYFEKKNENVIYFDIEPSKELEEFRWELSQSLKSFCQLRPFDYEKNFTFHITLAMKLSDSKFYAIKKYLEKKSKLNFSHGMGSIS